MQAEGNAIRDRLEAWAADPSVAVDAWPAMPDGIQDRNADVWEAPWPSPTLPAGNGRGGLALRLFRLLRCYGSTPSLGLLLLKDLRTVFGNRDALSTEDILRALREMEEAPWAEIKGRPLDARRLARFLHPYEVASKVVRIGTSTPRGYAIGDLHDAWTRYLGPPANESAHSATTATAASEP